MNGRFLRSEWRLVESGLVALLLLIVAGPVLTQEPSSTSSAADQTRNAGPIVRTFGTEGGYRTEVTTQSFSKLNEEDRRQVSLLMTEVVQHIGKGRDAIDADDTKQALMEVNKAREAAKAIRAMLPKGTVRTRTTAPDGKVIYEDEQGVQVGRIPLYEGILHAQTLAPILAARRNAMEVAGFNVIESERIATEVIADLDPIEGQLARTAKALEENKPTSPPRRWRWPWFGASISASTRKTRNWLRPATRSGWRGVARGEQRRPGVGQPRHRPAAVAGLPSGALAGRASGGGPDAPRNRPVGGPAPPGGGPGGRSGRAGPPGQHVDPVVGPYQRLVPPASLTTCPGTRVHASRTLGGRACRRALVEDFIGAWFKSWVFQVTVRTVPMPRRWKFFLSSDPWPARGRW